MVNGEQLYDLCSHICSDKSAFMAGEFYGISRTTVNFTYFWPASVVGAVPDNGHSLYFCIDILCTVR